MKPKLFIVLLAIVLSLGFSQYVSAHEGMTHEKGMEAIDHEKVAAMAGDNSANAANDSRIATEEDVKNLPNVNNKICPISGNPVDDGTMGESVKYVYNGKIYNLCCPMCVKDFKKNPEKYSKVAEDEVAKNKEATTTK